MTYSIHNIEPEDSEGVKRLTEDFFRLSGLPGEFDFNIFEEFWGRAIDAEAGFILILRLDGAPVGLVGGLDCEAPYTSLPTVHELFWWVDESHRGAPAKDLLVAFEEEAQARGAEYLLMGTIHGLRHEAMGRLYESRGYRPFEHLYSKEL